MKTEVKSKSMEVIETPRNKLKKEVEEKDKPQEHVEQLTIEEVQDILEESQEIIINILKQYLDLKEDYYSLISLWIIGTYFHSEFESYPYLFLNAMRGSGKTRTLKLITTLSKDGNVLASPTEAVLFRSNGTLGIDEFEGIGNKDKNSLRELLNASYKKGIKIMRMKKKKHIGGEEQVVESFEPYRPIVMANIWGMEEVLGDRCVSLVLEKSNNPIITKLVEDFSSNKTIENVVKNLNQCSLCSVVTQKNLYKWWNNYIINKYNTTLNTLTTINTITTQTTQQEEKNIELDKLFEEIDKSGISGRNLELFLPIFLISWKINKELLTKTIEVSKVIVLDRLHEEETESSDVQVIDFISKQEAGLIYYSVKELTNKFRDFIDYSNEEGDWLNPKWFGRALKRLNLIIEKRRASKGIEVMLNVKKAMDKIKIFRIQE